MVLLAEAAQPLLRRRGRVLVRRRAESGTMTIASPPGASTRGARERGASSSTCSSTCTQSTRSKLRLRERQLLEVGRGHGGGGVEVDAEVVEVRPVAQPALEPGSGATCSTRRRCANRSPRSRRYSQSTRWRSSEPQPGQLSQAQGTGRRCAQAAQAPAADRALVAQARVLERPEPAQPVGQRRKARSALGQRRKVAVSRRRARARRRTRRSSRARRRRRPAPRARR